MIRWRTGTRKASVLPVPVFACATLGVALAYHIDAEQWSSLHVLSGESSVDGHPLDVGHVLVAEVIGNRVDNAVVDTEFCEAGKL